MNSPALAALALLSATVGLGQSGIRQFFRRQTHYVSLHNSGLLSDLLATFPSGGDASVYLIGQGYLKEIGQHFVGTDVSDLNAADHRKRYPAEYRKLLRFLHQALRIYMRVLHASTFIGGNFTYWMSTPLGAALREAGFHFVVVHKEGLVSAWPNVAAEYVFSVRSAVGRSSASGVAVHSAATRDAIVASGVVDQDRIHVVGAPRLDPCHARRGNRNSSSLGARPVVTFFTFPLSLGIWFPGGNPTNRSVPEPFRDGWANLLDGIIEGARVLAVRCPGIDVYVKSKSEPAKYPEIAARLDALVREALPNLTVVSKGEGQSLVLSSAAVVAFNSTVVLEALAAGTPVYWPRFAEAAEPEAETFMMRVGDTVTYCESVEDLVRGLRACIDRGASSPVRFSDEHREVLARYAGNSDGRSGERLREWLAAIESASRANTKRSP